MIKDGLQKWETYLQKQRSQGKQAGNQWVKTSWLDL